MTTLIRDIKIVRLALIRYFVLIAGDFVCGRIGKAETEG